MRTLAGFKLDSSKSVLQHSCTGGHQLATTETAYRASMLGSILRQGELNLKKELRVYHDLLSHYLHHGVLHNLGASRIRTALSKAIQMAGLSFYEDTNALPGIARALEMHGHVVKYKTVTGEQLQRMMYDWCMHKHELLYKKTPNPPSFDPSCVQTRRQRMWCTSALHSVI